MKDKPKPPPPPRPPVQRSLGLIDDPVAPLRESESLSRKDANRRIAAAGYKILKQFSSGTYGKVHHALKIKPQKEVVCKIVTSQSTQNPSKMCTCRVRSSFSSLS